MESGAGKHWTEEEVKALLSIWAEKNIRKQLYGTLRNKGIFIYIAKRLQALGVYRDWKQCRAKYKNLKYEYRTVKYAHNSGDSSKTMKFFHDLDAILQYEPATQLTEEDANDRCLATLSQSTAPEITEGKMSVTSVDKEDIPGNPLLLVSHVRPMELVIAGDAAEDDLVSNLSEDLRETDMRQSPGTEEDTVSTASEEVGGPTALHSITGSGINIPLEDAKSQLQIITVSDTEAGKHWCDNEVRALINIWSDEKIKQMLEGATRNKEIFEEIARRLMQFGIDRDWKQCRTKYKNLKYEYRVLQKKNGNPQGKMRFYEEVDGLLRQPSLRTAKWKHGNLGIDPFKMKIL
eukprot:XP_007115998.2 zinc finger and SCAN domain-containing protein 20 [Physeter catodon]